MSMGVSSSSMFLAHWPGERPYHPSGIFNQSRNCKESLFSCWMYLFIYYFALFKIKFIQFTKCYLFEIIHMYLYTLIYTLIYTLYPYYLWYFKHPAEILYSCILHIKWKPFPYNFTLGHEGCYSTSWLVFRHLE